MLRVGLTGGIGAGKSTVAGRLAEHGALVIDADRIAREVVEPGTPGLTEIVEAFGADVLGPDGTLDRPALAARAFADGGSTARLNAIVHPKVGQRTAELMAAAPDDGVVVHDIPLLVEGGMAAAYQLVIVVDADVETRVSRLVGSRGLAEQDARARIKAQASEQQRRDAADVWLHNGGPHGTVLAEVDALWADRLVPFEANLRLGRRAAPAGVALADPDGEWPRQAERALARVRSAAGGAAVRADHIGSTAVPGLPAKDVIDLQLTVASLAEADGIAGALADGGFPVLPGDWRDTPQPADPRPEHWQKRVHGGADPGRPVNLHVRPADGPAWRLALLFRDWLRAEPAEREAYTAEKRRLAAEHAADPDSLGYAEAKQPYVDAALARAEAWASATAWTPG
jgi:dephospho-CoA kinase